jgi:hypothetical protein
MEETEQEANLFQKIKRKVNPGKYRKIPKVKNTPYSNQVPRFEREIELLANMPEGSVRKKNKKLKKLFKDYLSYLSKFRPQDRIIFDVLQRMKNLGLLPVTMDLVTYKKENQI